eukprot:COSAG01_NODE_25802_length_732_cov_3.364929_1_plen_140_part_00
MGPVARGETEVGHGRSEMLILLCAEVSAVLLIWSCLLGPWGPWTQQHGIAHRTGCLLSLPALPGCGTAALLNDRCAVGATEPAYNTNTNWNTVRVTLFGRVFACACVGLTRPLWEALESKRPPSPGTKYAHPHPLRGRN